ncbi:FadR/GntR family transcriptional regulator [Gilvimarinus chinensis]|uniref:FadR/GntR family transcriptional regulator n=1 Tax=Gilvimarinus chinensis TaxID=396005 RepID=UPI00037069DF|nr:FadR/GntR family transcriptional regulator [Gilvimarinus chinensis]
MYSLNGNRNLTHQVTYELGCAIVQGRYPVGDGFPTEAQLCRQYQISRSVVREAVKMLTAKGLLSSRPRQGIRVLPASAWNMFDPDVLQWSFNGCPSLALQHEFFELRMALEPDAAALAAQRQNDEVIQRLKHALATLEKAVNAPASPMEAIIDFHLSVLRASGNRFFVQLCHFIRMAIEVDIAAGRYSSSDYADYRAVAEAIIMADESGARDAMIDLLSRMHHKPDIALSSSVS